MSVTPTPPNPVAAEITAAELKALKVSQALLNNFSRFLPAVFFQYQRFSAERFCFNYASEAVERLFEFSAAELCADVNILFRKVHPADLSAFILSVRTAAEHLHVWTHEFRIVLKNGEERWMAGEASPELQYDGSLLWHGCFMDQTRSKQTERSLITAEQQRRLVMQASNQGLYDINLNTGAATFSPEYRNMIEHSIEEFADPFAFWDYFWKHSVHPDDVPGIKEAYRIHFASKGKTDYHAEFRQKNRAGEWRWIMSLGAAVEWDENQRAVRIVGTHIDITERKRTEEQLQLNQELLRSNNVRYKELARELEILIANAPVGIMFVSNGVIIRANEALADLCRFPDAKSMIGVKTTFLYHNDEDYRAFGQAVIPRLEADELVELEWYLRRANGESFMARVAGRALPAETYEKGAVWMVEDITEQRQTMDALRESESRLQRIMNSSLIGILYGSDGSRLTDVNRMFCQLSGYSRESLLAEQFLWRVVLSEQDQYLVHQAYTEMISTGTTAPFEVMLRRADGSAIPVLVGLGYLENSPREWAVFVMDISERQRINQLKTEFVSMVSHELRTPLTSIRGSLGLLESGVGGTLPDAARQLIRIAHNNSKRLVNLVNDILDIDKLNNGKMNIRSEPVDLIEMLHNAMEANEAYTSSLRVGLIMEQQVMQAWSLGDHDRLMQVMANLISNAAKFSPEGESVTVRIYQEQSHYHIAVSDRGPGIPLDFQTQLFEPFTQADGTNTRRQGGTGLGLAITKALVEKMHGEIFFLSCPGEGSTFWFSLPACVPPASAIT